MKHRCLSAIADHQGKKTLVLWGLLINFSIVNGGELELVPLGDLPGGTYSSAARAVSANGWVAVGQSSSAAGTEAFRWTEAGGMVGLGDLPGGGFYSAALSTDATGSVVVGVSSSAAGIEAFRWTDAGGMVGLGDLPGGRFYSIGRAVNADGTVVVGESRSTNGLEAFRWTDAGGMVGLGDLSGGSFYSIAHAVNADGSVIVGRSSSAAGIEAFRWTDAGGMAGLGDLSGGGFYSAAWAVNADGTVVVGESRSTNGLEAFRWTDAGGMAGLGDLSGGGFYSVARSVNADGTVVVGIGTSDQGSEAFRWTADDGMQTVAQWLQDSGVEIGGWTLGGAYGVNADGTVVVGVGINPDGNTEAWIARDRSGLITPAAFNASVAEIGYALGSMQIIETVAHGTSGHPYSRYRPDISDGIWLSGDFATDSRSEGEGRLVLGGIGWMRRIGRTLSVAMELGRVRDTVKGIDGSQVRTTGYYGVVEGDGAMTEEIPLYLTLTYALHRGKVKTQRGYDNAGRIDYSYADGIDRLEQLVRMRVQLRDYAGALHGWSPYLEYAYKRIITEGFEEYGGGFPVRFSRIKSSDHQIRIGCDFEYRLNEDMTLIASAEGVRTFHRLGGDVSANVIGLYTLTLGRIDEKRDWLRGSLGIEYARNDASTIQIVFNATTQSEEPDFWVGVNYRYSF
jgi:probable HAF family extracellular repeat protein